MLLIMMMMRRRTRRRGRASVSVAHEGVCVQFSKQKIQSLEKVVEMKTSKSNDTLAAAQKGLTQ